VKVAWELYQERGARALWERSLGFLDMDVEQTMELQHRLLNEQLALLNESVLGRLLFGEARPANYAQLREAIGLTSYEDYASTLGERREEVLPAKTHAWIRTSGRTGGQPRWVPLSESMYEAMLWPYIGLMIMAGANGHGDVHIRPNDRVLNMLAPRPYASGTMFRVVEDAWPYRMFPDSSPESEALPFDVRMASAFRSAMTEGADFVAGLSSVLAGIGESFADRKPPGSVLDRLKQPGVVGRMGTAALRAKFAGRRMLPRDVWNIRGIAVGGMDASLFRDRIRDYWGRYPLDLLASTEGGVVAMQGWDYTTMSLITPLNFFEFVSEDELRKEQENPGYRPNTVLLDGLEAGENYELVLTNLHGNPLVRYRTGDIVRVTALRNDSIGVALPQIVHYSRRTDLLEIGGFVRLTESTIWRAIEHADVPYVDWTVRKEVESGSPVLRLRMEPREGTAISENEAASRINRALGQIEPDWADMERMAGLHPLRITYLPTGSFDRYRQRKVSEGADLAHLKPLHINPPDEVLDTLLEVAGTREG